MNTKSILLIIAASVVMLACSTSTKKVSYTEKPVCVKTELLQETTAAQPIQCSGILTSKHTMKLSFKTGGIISKIYVDEGDYVKKGQILASLDMTEIDAQVSQAGLALDKAERDLKRVKNLYTDTVATLEQLQDAKSAYDAALNNKNIAEFNQRFSSITAPANGKIIAKLSEAHELIGAGMPVVVFTEQGTDEWIVKAGISDKDIVRLNNGDKALVTFDAFPGKSFPANVSQISEAADPLSGTFGIEVTVSSENERLINGFVAKIKIEPQNSQLVTLVPPEALTGADGKKAYVYVVNAADTTAQKVPVTIAYLQNNDVAVLERVNKMGQVITKGASYLEDGSKISIVK
jgi:multidrug efflux system membrane fusion protein